MQNKKIVFLASDCESSRWVYHACFKNFEFAAAIIEQPVSKRALFRSRVKKIGFFKVIGQTMFSVLAVPLLKRKARARKAFLVEKYGLNSGDFNSNNTRRVSSVNDKACKQLLQQIQPGIVLVNGTRIISKEILQSTKAVFINMHVGITPWYRGSHGGYWALYNNDPANFGTTIHLVDTGVDTGTILKQVFIEPAKADNFTTYPVLQVAEGIKAVITVIREMLEKDDFSNHYYKGKGKLYYQPTLWQYLFKKIK